MSTSHWKRVPLSEIAEVRLGRQRSPKRAVGPNMRPYMRAANVTWNGISLHDVKEMDFTPEEFETYALRPGDLLLSEASGSASEVGKPAVWNDEVPDCCFQNTLIRVRAPDSLVPFLHLHFYKDALTGEFGRAARGVGIHHLGAKTLSDWEVHLPPPDEQRRTVEAVDSYFTRLDHIAATLEQVRRNLKRHRASIRVRFTPAALARWTLGWLLSPSGRTAVEQAASSTSGLHTLSLSKVGHLPVPLPPLAEQARIIRAMDQYRMRAKTLEQTVALDVHHCDNLRQSVLGCAFRGELAKSVPSGSGTDPSRRYCTQ